MTVALGGGLMAAMGCMSGAQPQPPEPMVVDTVMIVDTVEVTRTQADPAQVQMLARLELQLLEKEALIQQLQQQLDEAMQEVVRQMAKLRSIATRAEAASGLAEARIAVDALRSAGSADAAGLRQVEQLLDRSQQEFESENYGGALYLATLAQREAAARTLRQGDLRPGERTFPTPVRLKVRTRSNVRDGPGTRFSVRFTLEPDIEVDGLSYTDEWIRIVAVDGREGWIFRQLVDLVSGASP